MERDNKNIKEMKNLKNLEIYSRTGIYVPHISNFEHLESLSMVYDHEDNKVLNHVKFG